MESTTATMKARRRRRAPEEAEAEIVAAALEFLRERPFRDLTVDEVMRRTDLSRPSFYVYFKDRYQLALRVLEDVGGQLFRVAERWFSGGGEAMDDLRDAISGTLDVWAAHAPELRALAHAAKEDAEVEVAWDQVRRAFVDAAARLIEEQIGAGEIRPIDPRETARALIYMNETYCLETVGREPAVERRIMLDTLLAIWSRTLYGESANH